MFRRSIPKILLTVILAALLAVPSIAAAESPKPRTLRARLTMPVPGDLLARLWSLLGRSQDKEGCGLDPHGGCTGQGTGSGTPPVGEAGCGLDPHGGCTGTP